MDPPNATADIKRVVKTQPHKTRAAELKPSSTMYQPGDDYRRAVGGKCKSVRVGGVDRARWPKKAAIEVTERM